PGHREAAHVQEYAGSARARRLRDSGGRYGKLALGSAGRTQGDTPDRRHEGSGGVTPTLERRVSDLEGEGRRGKGGQRRLEDSVMALKRSVDQSNAMLVDNNQMTSEIRELVTNLKGFGATVKWGAKAGKMLVIYVCLPFAALTGAGYALFHHGKFPVWWVTMMEFLFG